MITLLLVALLFQPGSQPSAPADAIKVYEEGNAAFAKQEYTAALAAFDRAIALDPKNADFHRARCRTLATLQRHAEGVESCSTALELRPDDGPTLVDRGHYYINLRKLDLALADLTRADAKMDDDHGLFYHLALAQYLNGDFAKASETYEGCVRTAKTPDNQTACRAWQYLALRRAGRTADAEKLLAGFTPAEGQAPSAYGDRLLLFKGVRTEEEVAKGMETSPLQLPTAGYGIGVWHLLNGREEKAREYFQKALAPPALQTAFGAVASHYELARMKR